MVDWENVGVTFQLQFDETPSSIHSLGTWFSKCFMRNILFKLTIDYSKNLVCVYVCVYVCMCVKYEFLYLIYSFQLV